MAPASPVCAAAAAAAQLLPGWRINLQRLGRDASEASEVAAVLQEIAPGLQVDGLPLARGLSSSPGGTPTAAVLRERVLGARPIETAPGRIPWGQLSAAVPSGTLQDAGGGSGGGRPRLLEVNTGGAVFFALFRPDAPATSGGGGEGDAGATEHTAQQQQQHRQQEEWEEAQRHPAASGAPAAGPGPTACEGIAVVKLGSSRLAMAAEQFANELARHLGVAAPACRVVRQESEEWAAARAAAAALGPCGEELCEEMARLPCFLCMDFAPGSPLLAACGDALQGPAALSLLADTGRLLLLDMLLGNADRLPFSDLGWRGNPSNVLMGAPGSRYAGRVVAIDSCVARRPPALKSCAEDAAVERAAQLIVGAEDAAGAALRQLLGVDAAAACGQEGVEAFQRGFRETLARVLRIKGLLEMVHAHTSEWVAGFLEDAAAAVPGLRGPAAGGARPLALGELAAGVRTPPHMATLRPSGGGGSARVSPRGSCSRDGPSPIPPLLMGGSPCALRAGVLRAARSFTAGGRAPSGSLPVGLGLPPASPIGSAGACEPPAAPPGGPARSASATAGSRPLLRPLFAEPGDPAAGSKSGSDDAAGPLQLPPLSPSPAPSPRRAPGPPAAADPALSPPARRASSDEAYTRYRAAMAAPLLAASPHRSPRDGPAALSGGGSLGGGLSVSSVGPSALAAAVTGAIAGISAEARRDEALAAVVAAWKERCRDKAAKLTQAMAAWQARQQAPGPTPAAGAAPPAAAASAPLTTGFLDGSHPLVDAYELAVRLDHTLRRLAALQAAAAVEPPARVAARLFLSGAVAADGHHLLAHLGVTHVVVAAEELLPPPPGAGFEVLRVPLRDTDAEDIAAQFEQVWSWIDEALGYGGAVLVHCSEGRSRSVALVASYLMAGHGLDLAAALAAIRSVRPAAAPNPGFLSALAALDERLHGAVSLAPGEAAAARRRLKPEARRCPLCGAAVGVSSGSLAVHMRARHRGAVAAARLG